ncbi:bifunctional adenosylcobinamide kinase/adenosylcobinamide-phosphate guanylyltransferase [Tumebacillus flagellatus]|uniref:Adenosylcobinamide kinase n=1 Tax=Tumebacillus flagellatus TaxID=1157490 RepID=A0A074M711_9BACL|nr:bifunctional adenosylcobinamide kinase/adenosylcobinamide-phosphate guanylyltransferase [Tumebacillus flagellatus]KEO81797.1 hypothetical protein EL26_18315 [Tumebacillus flagellatus]
MPYTLITGGVRSGKSAWAERVAGLSRRVLYVATGQVWDEEMERRIDVHRDRRPAQWGLLEVQAELAEPLMEAMQDAGQPWEGVLIDDLSTWVSTVLLQLPEEEWRSEGTRNRLFNEATQLAARLRQSSVPATVVTNETGLGGVALTPLGRAFQDLLGVVNQIFAAQAEDVYLVVSGRPLKLPNVEETFLEEKRNEHHPENASLIEEQSNEWFSGSAERMSQGTPNTKVFSFEESFSQIDLASRGGTDL